jgi:hypothetical protein
MSKNIRVRSLLRTKLALIQSMTNTELVEVCHALELDLERRLLGIRRTPQRLARFRSLLSGLPLTLLADAPSYPVRTVKCLHEAVIFKLNCSA